MARFPVKTTKSDSPAGDGATSDSGSYRGVVHEYDGIEEHDNHLPTWWLTILYGSIVFSVGYWFYYETFGAGAYPKAAFDSEQAVLAAAEADKLKSAGVVTSDSLLKLSLDPSTVKEGKDVFLQTCATCHLATGGGSIGPNLTDAFWLHGGAPDQVYTLVRDGFLPKGMPAWGPQLGESRVRAVSAYVLTLRNTNVAAGKAPQGDRAP
jgi:cytochrome c oxidase cbb3-type subunit 3